MKNLKSGFTLVELIVVITILAILGTIAFISLQWYSADARNSKRTSDLNSITSVIKSQLTQGQSYMAFITTVVDNQSNLRQISGTAATILTEYNAGTINYTALPVKASDFQDPTNNAPYVIGATIKTGGAMELAASMEQGGQRVAKLMGDWVPRTTATSLVSWTGTLSWTTWALAEATNINKMKVGDTYSFSWGATNYTWTILSVSPDGMNFTLSNVVSTWATQIRIANSEITGLIDKKDSGSGAAYVADGSSTNLPY